MPAVALPLSRVKQAALAVAALWLTACPPPVGYSTCERDQDCPGSYRCDPVRRICQAGDDAGAVTTDASSRDTVTVDAADRDAGQTGADGSGADGWLDDAGAVDADQADAAPSGDAAAADATGGADATTADVNAAADAQPPDVVAAQDAAAVDGGATDTTLPPLDAGLATDGGLAVDAGLPGDAGAPLDAGASTEAGAGLDAAGSDAVSGLDVAVVNTPPTAAIVFAGNVYPGEANDLQGAGSDPDQLPSTLIYLWSIDAPPAGVGLSATDRAQVQLQVDRSVYEGGPQAHSVTVRFRVTDAAGAYDEQTATVVILDERGGFVSKTSAFAGTGYAGVGFEHGFCGAPAHPCNNIADALVNLTDLRAEDGSVLPQVQVASTGTYTPASTLVLDGGLDLICGFDAASWTRTAGQDRSLIRFTAATGVLISSAARLEGCDIEGVASIDSLGGVRTAVRVEHAGAELRDNRLVAFNLNSASHSNVVGVRVILGGNSAGPLIRENRILGGQASATATGIYVTGGQPQIRLNAIEGGTAATVSGVALELSKLGQGSAARVEENSVRGGVGGSAATDTAVGIVVGSGDPLLKNNDPVEGGASPNWSVGLWIHSGAGGTRIEGNNFVGAPQSASVNLAAGARIAAAVDASANIFEGGYALGAVAVQVAELAEAPAPFAAVFRDNILRAGVASYSAVGLLIGSGATVQVIGGDIAGVRSGAFPGLGYGIEVADAGALTVESAQVASGLGLVTVALHLADSAGDVSVSTTTLHGGGSGGNAGEVWGVRQQGGTLALHETAVIAHEAPPGVVGVEIAGLASALTITGGSISAAAASNNGASSRALWSTAGVVKVAQVSGQAPVSITSGAAGQESVAVDLSCDTSISAVEGHSLVGLELQAGEAARSIGLRMQGCASATLDRLEILAGAASAGPSLAVLLDGCQRSSLSQSTLTAGASAGNSAGLWLATSCPGCLVHGNFIEAGPSYGAVPHRSVGARLLGNASDTVAAYVFSNVISAAAGRLARGVEMSGRGGHRLRLFNNTIFGGGESSGESIGVLLGETLVGPGVDHVGGVVGNIIDPGVAADSYNIVEAGSCDSSNSVWAEPAPSYSDVSMTVDGGRNNDLWPAGKTALLQDFNPVAYAGNCAQSVTDLARVNAIAPYTATGIQNDATHSVDPLFAGDGYHLSAGSPLVDRAFWSSLWATGLPVAFTDIDGVARPTMQLRDIGCDER